MFVFYEYLVTTQFHICCVAFHCQSYKIIAACDLYVLGIPFTKKDEISIHTKIEPSRGKTNNVVSEQVLHKRLYKHRKELEA